MTELGKTQSTNIHNTRLLIRTLKYVLDILQMEKAFTVEEYKHTHTHTHIQRKQANNESLAFFKCKKSSQELEGESDDP